MVSLLLVGMPSATDDLNNVFFSGILLLCMQVVSLLLAGMPSATDDHNNAIGFDKVHPALACGTAPTFYDAFSIGCPFGFGHAAPALLKRFLTV